MSKFKLPTRSAAPTATAPAPDAQAFVAGADPAPAPPAGGHIVRVAEVDMGGRLSESLLLRLSPQVMADLDEVFARSSARSRQKLIEALLVPRLRQIAKALRDGREVPPISDEID